MIKLGWVFIAVFVVLLLWTSPVYAQSGLNCSVGISPNSVQPNSTATLNFNVTNTGVPDIVWVWIGQQAEEVLSVQTGSGSGWSILEQATGMVLFGGGAIPSGNSASFSINITSGSTIGAISDWKVMASHLSGGNETVYCTGDSQVSVASAGATNPVISNLTVSVGSSSTTLSWQTNTDATGVVSYGTTSGYGSSLTTASGTSHSVTMSSLSSSTTYHYQISVTGGGGTSSTTDATFTTSAASVTTTTTTTVTETVTATVTKTVILADTVKPVVKINTKLEKPYTEAPIIEGRVVDSGDVNVGINRIQYSTDGGKNWLLVDEPSGASKVDFAFVPEVTDDGNYQIQVRATDKSGNTGVSVIQTLVIDRLPPQVGGSLFALGPMILQPDSSGRIYSIAGLDLKVILSAVGGPIEMNLSFDSQGFPLLKNQESGLWSSLFATSKTGSYPLIVKSLDGADNRTEKTLGTLVSLPPGRILDETGKPLSQAKVSVYIFDKVLSDYVLWESEPYLQTNPQTTDDSGEYHFLLPAGKYFLETTSPDRQKLRTEIFEVTSATPTTQSFTLKPRPLWRQWWATTVPYQASSGEARTTTDSLIGKSIPSFDLSVAGLPFSHTSILGRPSILTFISSWEPQTSDQLLVLDRFKSHNEGVNVYAVAVQESVSKTNIFRKSGGYLLPVVADPDGLLVLPLSLQSLPTHLFLDRKGIIKAVSAGFLDESNLLDKILN